MQKKKSCAGYGKGGVTDQTCQVWFAKFCDGDFLLDDAPQSGRPVEVGSCQIETLIENNEHYTMWEITDILKISKSMKLLVKMKNVSSILWKENHTDFLTKLIIVARYLGFIVVALVFLLSLENQMEKLLPRRASCL